MNKMKYIKPKRQFRDSDPFVIKSGDFKNAGIGSSYRETWSEGVFISDNKEREMVGRSFDFSKLTILGVFLAVFVSILLGRTAWLQIVRGDYYAAMADGNRIRIERIEPKRGVIYDRNKKTLVRNQANFLLYFIPADLPSDKQELDKIISEICRIDDTLKKEELESQLLTIPRRSLEAFQPLFITDNIDYEKAMELYLRSADWPGVVMSNATRREYLPVGNKFFLDEEKKEEYSSLAFSHLLGYAGKISSEELEKSGDEYLPIDYIGKMGIEYFWESELKGISGKKQIEVDALGKEKKIIGKKEAVDGRNLLLSIDLEKQLKLEEIIAKHLFELKLSKASAVFLDPNNGEILAMVSLPSYNNNLFAKGISSKDYAGLINHPDRPLFNRAVSGEFPAGSTFKPVMLAAALEERVISEDTAFVSTGGLRIGQWFFPDWRAGGHGRTDARKAISDSVNTFFYYIGGGYNDFTGLGVERIVEYARKFGLGAQTGIDLPGEASGFLPSKEWKKEVKGEQWYIGDTYHLSIGQGDLLATPLQVAVFTSVFANGGKLYRPHLVKELMSGDDRVDKVIETSPVREDFIDDYNMKVVREGMRQTVTAGSGRRLSILPVSVAGKTGTAQWSSTKENHAWFAGFAPYEKPEIAFVILIEEGKEGSTAAVPIVYDYLSWYFKDRKPEVRSEK